LSPKAEILTEWRAKRALARLKSSTPRQATVLRDGQAARVIPAKDVVRGDVVMLQAGMVTSHIHLYPYS
jgi:Ca2+-transporting ATPase